jgi:hypothetical protein
MLGLDHNAAYLLWALGTTVTVLGGYGLYLRSRLMALRRRAAASNEVRDYSARKVTAAAPMVTTAHPASSANGPTTS